MAIVASGPAIAGDLVAEISDGSTPVADAVVIVKREDGAPAKWSKADVATARVIDQSNEQFTPLVTILPIGGSVVFKNSDRTRHHVYSFSSVKPFEFVMNPGTQSPPVMMDQEGVAAIGCNIHDRMVAYVYVSATPLAALSTAEGRALISGLADGNYIITVWHPRLRAGEADPTTKITVNGRDPVTAKFTLSLSAERPHGGRHTREY